MLFLLLSLLLLLMLLLLLLLFLIVQTQFQNMFNNNKRYTISEKKSTWKEKERKKIYEIDMLL